jgi:HAUS augmin-like complex subunit 1
LGFTNNADYANAFGDDGTLAAARLREILECIGLSQENLSQSGVMAAQTLANVAHLLDVKDTETSRYVCFSLEHLLILQTTLFDSNA